MIPITKIALKQEFTGDRQTNQIQTNAFDAARFVNNCPILFGTALLDSGSEDITFTAGQTRSFVHRLKRTPVHFLVTDASGTAGYPSIRRTTSDDTSISLQSANACTVKVWVY